MEFITTVNETASTGSIITNAIVTIILISILGLLVYFMYALVLTHLLREAIPKPLKYAMFIGTAIIAVIAAATTMQHTIFEGYYSKTGIVDAVVPYERIPMKDQGRYDIITFDDGVEIIVFSDNGIQSGDTVELKTETRSADERNPMVITRDEQVRTIMNDAHSGAIIQVIDEYIPEVSAITQMTAAD